MSGDFAEGGGGLRPPPQRSQVVPRGVGDPPGNNFFPGTYTGEDENFFRFFKKRVCKKAIFGPFSRSMYLD